MPTQINVLCPMGHIIHTLMNEHEDEMLVACPRCNRVSVYKPKIEVKE